MVRVMTVICHAYQGWNKLWGGGGRYPQISMQWGETRPLTPHFLMASLYMVQLKFGDERICLLVNTVPTDNCRPIWYKRRHFCGLVPWLGTRNFQRGSCVHRRGLLPWHSGTIHSLSLNLRHRPLKLRTDGGYARVRELWSIGLFVVTSLNLNQLSPNFEYSSQLCVEYWLKISLR